MSNLNVLIGRQRSRLEYSTSISFTTLFLIKLQQFGPVLPETVYHGLTNELLRVRQIRRGL